ncbi:acyl-CoA synthetase (AMP-forming)/AMP-acid ligase II [Tamaricihabitans halophyticus]|uniref:Acyl-CoA synthetase (AMP-forming)/AMP-acid ligase II n=1 Tax=Tamaricihabitans halophyticus TaxID=1262583 RepID=A0A4R2QUC0_9PSEU|nr:AMP-binding protein [Tamaricihabitans halophyticus]TCP53560.1 acyl-CoA synthetase (AMP-forming)/AMP-acid ligase II [Tamaricihabitans halophyticus]
MRISDLLRYSAHRAPDAEALWFNERTYTYRQLYDQVCRLANGLRERASPGDRVAILAENSPEYVLSYYGVPLAGMGLVFLNYRLSEREINDVLTDAEPTILITESAYLDTARAALVGVESVHTLVTIDAAAAGTTHFAELLREPPMKEPDTGDDELAWLIYTSGTTGRPKGAVLTHRNVTAAACNSAMSWEADPGGSPATLFPWPLCHIAGYGVLVAHLRLHRIVLLRRYDPATFLAEVPHHRITHTTVAPTMLALLLRHPDIDKHDLSSVVRIGYGSAPMPAQTLRDAMRRFPTAGFQTGFGMTELGGNVLYHTMADHVSAIEGRTELLTSVGKPMALAAVKVVDEQGNEVPRGVVGELVISGEQVAVRYWRRPDASAETFRDGWLHTGDLATQDENGYFYIVDRKKDMVLTGGENVYSREVEEILHQHPSVAAAAIVGQPDEVWGERVVAVVEGNPAGAVSETEIIEYCKQHLAGYKCPRTVIEVAELPRNTVGKILKRQVREQLTAE